MQRGGRAKGEIRKAGRQREKNERESGKYKVEKARGEKWIEEYANIRARGPARGFIGAIQRPVGVYI